MIQVEFCHVEMILNNNYITLSLKSERVSTKGTELTFWRHFWLLIMNGKILFQTWNGGQKLPQPGDVMR